MRILLIEARRMGGSEACHEYRRYNGVAGSDQSVVWRPHCVPISSQTLPSIPTMTQRRLLIFQQEEIAQTTLTGS